MQVNITKKNKNKKQIKIKIETHKKLLVVSLLRVVVTINSSSKIVEVNPSFKPFSGDSGKIFNLHLESHSSLNLTSWIFSVFKSLSFSWRQLNFSMAFESKV